jgi:5-methylthioadenosine/S-adenosylhomocysteine deaminase
MGTDGAATNNTQDLFESAKVAALVSRIRKTYCECEDLAASEIVQILMTGSRVFGTGFGKIEVGAVADLTLVNISSVRTVPIHDIDRALIYSSPGAQVYGVIVQGRALLLNGKLLTIDEDALLRECEDAAIRFADRSGWSKGILQRSTGKSAAPWRIGPPKPVRESSEGRNQRIYRCA